MHRSCPDERPPRRGRAVIRHENAPCVPPSHRCLHSPDVSPLGDRPASAGARLLSCGKPAVVPSAISMAAPTAHDKLAEVVEAGTAIARGLDLDETLQAVVEAAARVTRASLLRARRARARPPHQPLHHDGPDARAARAARQPPDGPGHPGRAHRRGAPAPSAQALGRSALRRLPAQSSAHGLVPGRAGSRVAAASSAISISPRRPTETSRTRTSASCSCSQTWPPSRSRTPVSTSDATEQTEQARRAAQARMALTGAAAAVLREHDLVDAMRLVAREAVTLLDVRLVAVGVPDEFAGMIRYDVAEGPGAETFETSPVPLARFLRRLRPARRRRDARRRPADRRAR